MPGPQERFTRLPGPAQAGGVNGRKEELGFSCIRISRCTDPLTPESLLEEFTLQIYSNRCKVYKVIRCSIDYNSIKIETTELSSIEI